MADMKRALTGALAFLPALFVPSVVAAAEPAVIRPEPIAEAAVLSGKARLDPGKGYIYLHAPTRMYGLFLRVPDDATRAEHQKDWEKGFEKAKKRYATTLDNWKTEALIARTNKKEPPEKPEPPTAETFSIAPIDLRDVAYFGPASVYAKGQDFYSYLEAIKPGTYIWYGAVVIGPNGGAGTCNCMGTVRFEVRPGVVTDLGNYLLTAPAFTPTDDVAALEASARAAAEPGSVKAHLDRVPQFGVPDSLKGWNPTQAEFHANGKLNNFYGITVTRLPTIPGILEYRRDVVIDGRTHQDLPSPRIVTRAKIKK